MLQKEVPDATVLEGLCLSAPVTAEQKGDDTGVLTLYVCCTARDMTLYGNPDLDFERLVSLLPCDDGNLNLIAEKTRGQRTTHNTLWSEMRKGLIPASDIKRVFTSQTTVERDPKADCSKLVQHIICRGSIKSEAMEWGRQKESRARSHVERKKYKTLTVKEQGLRISSQKPFIGCSVDGLVSCECHGPEKRLVDIKCPFNLRFMTPKEAAKQRGCEQDPVSGAWSLKENSPFYYQIQAQLFVYGLSHCDLVIYTHQGILSVPVKFNNLFASEIIRKVEEFYKTHVAPTLLYDDVH